MSNIITEIEQSLNDVPPLKIDIAPVTIPSAPPVDLTKIAPPITPPQLTPVQPSQPQSPPLEAVQSSGSPQTPLPVIDALSFGDTISNMSADSAAETARVLADTTPKSNSVADVLNPMQAPVQINPQLSSQNNPFAASKANSPQNASERLAFEPPRLANGMANPFSDPNARAAVAAGISKEEYLAYIRDAASKGDDLGFGTPVTGNNTDAQLQQKARRDNWANKNADQIRAEMAKKTGYLSGRRNFNMSFLPLSGGENRSELETLFSALALPANLFKGIGLDILRLPASVISGGFNVEEIKKAYAATRPTSGGTFTGAAILGTQFSSLAQIDEKGAQFNPLAAVRDDKNIFQVGLGFGLDILADPLNSDILVGRLLRPFGRANKVVDVIAELPKVDVPIRTPDVPRLPEPERFRVQRELATAIPENTKPLSLDVPRLNPPAEVVVSREIARNQELATIKPVERVFIEPSQPFTPIPDSRAIVPTVPEVNLYNNVTSAFNDSPSLPEVQQLMREVVEYRAIPDERALSVVVRDNPIIQDVLEFARTGDITPNIAVLQGATKSEIAAIVADRLELIKETPFVVPKLEIELPREVPRLEYNTIEQMPRQPARNANSFMPEPKPTAVPEAIPTPTSNPVVLGESLINNIADLKDEVRIDSLTLNKEMTAWMPKKDNFTVELKDVIKSVDDLGIDALSTTTVDLVVTGRQGKMLNSTVERTSRALNRLPLNDINIDVAKSLFDGLWRKSKDRQRIIITSNIDAKRLDELGLEKVQTKLPPPPDLPALSYVKASTVTPEVVDAYRVANNSAQSIENLRVAVLREQGFTGREASSMKVHPLSEEIATTGRISDTSLERFLKGRELSVSTPAERNWSSKMLKDIWEVATPAQKALIVDSMKANDLEYLGLERIARSNVVDDYLPKEGLFDIPC